MPNQDFVDEVEFACDLTALTAEQRATLATLTQAIFPTVSSVRELDNGYAFQLSSDSVMLFKLAEFIDYDRLCCPFVGHGMDVDPHGGAIWLKFTGSDGIKAFVAAEIGSFLTEQMASAAGFRPA